MTNESFDLMRVAGLRPKKKDTVLEIYGGFNRRMMAATIDSLIALLTIAPLIDYALGHMMAGATGVDMAQLQMIMQEPNEAVRLAMLKGALGDSGVLGNWLFGSAMQTLGLLVASAVCWKFWSATPGKIILRMKIVDATTHAPMNDKQIIVRSFGYILSCAVAFLGIIWIGIDKKKQGWHDKMAHTVVIDLNAIKLGLSTVDQ